MRRPELPAGHRFGAADPHDEPFDGELGDRGRLLIALLRHSDRVTAAAPERVVPRPADDARVVDGVLRATLPPVSWTASRP